jgi:hypothetical protein
MWLCRVVGQMPRVSKILINRERVKGMDDAVCTVAV